MSLAFKSLELLMDKVRPEDSWFVKVGAAVGSLEVDDGDGRYRRSGQVRSGRRGGAEGHE